MRIESRRTYPGNGLFVPLGEQSRAGAVVVGHRAPGRAFQNRKEQVGLIPGTRAQVGLPGLLLSPL